MTISADWQLAGLTTGGGSLDRPTTPGVYATSERVEVEGDGLLVIDRRFRFLEPSRELLADFVAIDTGSPEAVARFANTHGTLDICEAHGLPRGHAGAVVGYAFGGCPPQTDDIGADFWEPFSAWERFVGQARSMLNIAAALHRGRSPDRADWEHVWPADTRDALLALPGLEHQKNMLATAVNTWLQLGAVSPSMVWGPKGTRKNPAVTFGGVGMLGALAVQLMMATIRTQGLAICSGCGVPFVPERRPSRGRRVYCRECRDRKVPQRDAARDYRRKGSRNE
jgi:hypothetical protein